MENDAKPIFFVATIHERELVAQAGYEAIACVNQSGPMVTVDDFAPFAAQLATEGATGIILLESYSAKALKDACVEARASSYIPDLEIWRVAVKSNNVGESCALFVEGVSEQAIMQQAVNNDYLLKKNVYDSSMIAHGILEGRADRKTVPTGISNLDALLDGGLTEGALTMLGALSSAGKTTLCVQILDNMARAGRHCLFVTCEQSRYEIVAMSISRIVRQGSSKTNVTRGELQNPDRRANWPEPVARIVGKAVEDYTTNIGPRMHIMECDEQPSASEIRNAAMAIKEIYGVAPAVCVDYLQLIRHENPRDDERTATNDTVSRLRRLARDLHTPVIVISALNRKSISQGVTQQAFRESSGIEYAADLMLGMQPSGMTESLQGITQANQETEANRIIDNFRDAAKKQVEIRILKNRQGPVPKNGAQLIFEGASSYFMNNSATPAPAPMAASGEKPKRARRRAKQNAEPVTATIVGTDE